MLIWILDPESRLTEMLFKTHLIIIHEGNQFMQMFKLCHDKGIHTY